MCQLRNRFVVAYQEGVVCWRDVSAVRAPFALVGGRGSCCWQCMTGLGRSASASATTLWSALVSEGASITCQQWHQWHAEVTAPQPMRAVAGFCRSLHCCCRGTGVLKSFRKVAAASVLNAAIILVAQLRLCLFLACIGHSSRMLFLGRQGCE